MKGMTIGELAKAAGVHLETVRYYERRGLLPQAPRTESGYRMFGEDSLEVLRWIREAQGMGFTLEEIKGLLALRQGQSKVPTEEIYRFAQRKVQEVEEKIRQLEQLKSVLELVTKQPPSAFPLPVQSCPVLRKITEGGAVHE